MIQAPGQVLERGTVVLRDGLIAEVSADPAIPYDAEIIEGDSLTIYAGFIDGLSHAGLAEAERERDSDAVNPADPPPERAGIQPNRSARELLDPAHSSVGELREIGFTVAHVVPQGRMLPGIGSIVLLTGNRAAEMVLRPDVSLFMQFSGARGVYPATPMGVIAKLRQLYREAERSMGMERLYDENPAGIDRPSYDPIHQAFYPVIDGEKPLFVRVDGSDGALEVHRAIGLRDELGFSLALAGLNQGFDVVGTLEEAGVPLFVTLSLPSEPGEDEDEDEEGAEAAPDTTAADTTKAVTPDPPAGFFVSDLRTHSYEDVERESEDLEARRAASRAQYVATAAKLHEADLPFGFTTIGASPKDIRSNIREMIEAGLPEEAALAALTTDGARLLGIERNAGTIEPGKLANLVVTKGSYFEEDGSVRHVFVDGRKYDYDDGEDDDSLAVQIAGTWNLQIRTPDGTTEAELTVAVREGSLEGQVESADLQDPADLVNPSFAEGVLSFELDTSAYGLIEAQLEIDGDSLAGTIDVPDAGVFDVTGSRVP